MSTTDDQQPPKPGVLRRARSAADAARERAERTIFWNVWERMLETEFVDRSVALAGKAFVSFFPLVIVVAAFLPASTRESVFTALTSRLGVRGSSLELARQAFRSSADVRRATGLFGLAFTFFFASSFTTALQRIYLRAWRRPRDLKVGSYTRGLIWLAAMLVYLAATGAVGKFLGHGIGLGVFIPVALALSVAWWWFSGWYLLLGHVRWRVLFPGALITAVAMGAFALSAGIWMPNVVEKNQNQFGFFGIALALVTWFSGAAICIIVGACAGPVLAEDAGRVGEVVRGDAAEVLNPGAPASSAPPERSARLRDAFRPRADVADDG